MRIKGKHLQLSWIFLLFTVSYMARGAITADSIDQVRAEIYDFGIYELQGKIILIQDASNTAGYRSHVDSVKEIVLKEQTETIPLVKDILFGYRIRLHGVPEGNSVIVNIRYRHPPMIGKNGKESTGFTNNGLIKSVNGKFESGVMYRLREDYEIVPGKWIFDLIYQGKVIATKTFTTR